ncbi:MAG TPA: hypothetical protein VFQ44_11955 [Streptosporangiaceae bacterium]|nr:hypothetical protein [Streptosporangiaceae bacterium]
MAMFPWFWPTDAATTAVAWAVPDTGEPLLVTGHDDGGVRIWDDVHDDALRGRLIRTMTGAGAVRSLACARLPDGTLLVASGHDDGRTLIRNLRSGEVVQVITQGAIHNLAMTVLPGGVWLVAVDAPGFTPVVAHAGAYVPLYNTTGARSAAFAVLADGRMLLATGHADGRVLIHDGQGPLLRTLHIGRDGEVNSVAWAVLPDGRALLAACSDDDEAWVWDGDEAWVWDGESGALLHAFPEASGPIHAVAWAVLPDGRPVLATGGRHHTHLWDDRTFEQLASLPGAGGTRQGLALAQAPDGHVLLATTPDTSERPARIWTVDLTPRASESGGAAQPRSLRLAMAGLLAFGRVDLWAPLGLIDDLATITGSWASDLGLNDSRLRSVVQHPGIRRLRELCWPVSARLAFAGLLASGLRLRPGFRPPPGTPMPVLRDALSEALATVSDRQPAEIDAGELAAAADAITDRVVSMLAILGPRAVEADPALALLMMSRAAALPVLAGKQLRMLGETRPGRARPRESDGGLRHAPGTAGVGRRGSLTQLLPTQLALPPDLLAIRYIQDHLLYRRHVARAPLIPEPVTLILDATPPTFGGVENVLRLVAHLVTVLLWEHGQHPVLVSLAEPAVATPLTGRAQLALLWATRSLSPPGPALSLAVETAAGTGTAVALLTHHHTSDRYFRPGPDQRLVTTHHAAEPAPPPPWHPNHYHIPPDPDEALITSVSWALLTRTEAHLWDIRGALAPPVGHRWASRYRAGKLRPTRRRV